jgi:excisionase family DNA binding protein
MTSGTVTPIDPDETSRGASAERLLTADEVAALLSVPTSWVREATRSGYLPSVSLGRYRRYRLEAVGTWVREQERGGAAWRRHRPTLNGGTNA